MLNPSGLSFLQSIWARIMLNIIYFGDFFKATIGTRGTLKFNHLTYPESVLQLKSLTKSLPKGSLLGPILFPITIHNFLSITAQVLLKLLV